jgi:ribosomal protein S8
MSNFVIADFVCRLNVALRGHLKSIDVPNYKIIIELLTIFYKNGLISSFNIKSEVIRIFFKFYQNRIVFYSIKVISTPGHRVRWSLNELSYKYNAHAFGGFYIISTSKGLITSNDCLLGNRISGEILLKISV